MRTFTDIGLNLAENGWLSDHLVRHAIRHLCRRRLIQTKRASLSRDDEEMRRFIEAMNNSDIAPLPEKANEQHYELPPEFFNLILGKHNKYSCGYWKNEDDHIDASEEASLHITCNRAGIENGESILELGCGWGSLTLWISAQFPDSHIMAVSNSNSQRNFILERARTAGLQNIEVITADINEFNTAQQFDRIISIELFEHLRNYQEIFRRIHSWLKDDGKFFMHIFCYKYYPYKFEDRGPTDWMARHFFTGGIMPSRDLPLQFQEHLKLDCQWHWNGLHYQHTANRWLENLDKNSIVVKNILAEVYGCKNEDLWFNRWRLFFMACAELFGMAKGAYWGVGHYLFVKNISAPPAFNLNDQD
ncbi:MAG: SAM-dependent methyltransferase [Acidiferrobacteraceae bacterium]|nr:SAM-dependent methyltransferase [Acidiferrobacteraceae bacterium]